MKEDEKKPAGFEGVGSLEYINVFEEFSKDVLLDMAACMKPVTLKEGETLFSQGDEAESMYIVIDGRLQAMVTPEEGKKIVVMEMGAGVPVGEIALLIGGKRNASVVAVSDTKLAELTRKDFEEILKKYPEIRVQLLKVLLNRLRRSLLAKVLPEYFGEMNEATFHYIESQFEWVHIERDQVLYRKGETADSLYILINGLLNVVEEEKGKSPRLIGVIPWGEIAGEAALLTDEKRRATIYAARESDLVKLSKAAFERICEKFPQVMITISRILIHRLDNRGKRAQQRNIALNIAVIPAAPGVPIADFSDRLAAALSSYGPTSMLTARKIDTLLNKKGISQITDDDPRSPGLAAWLIERESLHSFMIYRAEDNVSHWTRRCLSRADKVIIVGDANASPAPGIIERELLSSDPESISSGRILILLHPDGSGLPSGTADWLNRRSVQRHYHIRWNSREDFERLARILSDRAIGLALGGGSAKGMAHIGVIRALKEAGVPIDMVGGTSMGAIIGAKYAMGSDYKGILEMAHKIFLDINPFNEYTLPLISILKSRKIEYMGKLAYGDTDIEDLWLNFFCVASNLTTSKLKVYRRGPLWKAVRASSALPGMVTPVVQDGDIYVDGGVINNLPGDIVRRQCGVVIVAEVDPNLNLSFRFDTIPSPWKVFWSKVLPFKKALKVPNIFDIMMSTLLTGSVIAAGRVKQNADLVLAPPVAEIGLLEFKKMNKTAEIGYRYTLEVLEKLDEETRKKLLIR
jgi:NTE family protein/lysophospholipid hydrolase